MMESQECERSLPHSVLEVRLVVHFSSKLTEVLRIRRKRPKTKQTTETLTADVNDTSDEEFVEGSSTPTKAPSTPPQSPKRVRKKQLTKSRDVLRVNLGHGDILIQCGSGLQKFYEVSCVLSSLTKHSAVPLGMRIAATARFIETEYSIEQNSPSDAVNVDLLNDAPETAKLEHVQGVDIVAPTMDLQTLA